jgi:hypothetical protein
MWMVGRIFRSIMAFQRISYDQLQADDASGQVLSAQLPS